MPTLRSEFLEITSTSNLHYVPLDLGGATQVMFRVDPLTSGGALTNMPFENSPRFPLGEFEPFYKVVSDDNRLYWVSSTVDKSTLFVWIIRRY